MSEDMPQTPEQLPIDSRWQDAIDNAEAVILRQYPDAPVDKQAELIEDAKKRLATLASSPTLKFYAPHAAGGEIIKYLEPITSDGYGKGGLPIDAVIDFLGYGDSHEFKYGVPDPDENPWYLQTVSDLTGKQLEAYIPFHPVIYITPEVSQSV